MRMKDGEKLDSQGIGAGLGHRTGNRTSEQLPDGTRILLAVQGQVLADMLVDHKIETDLLTTVSTYLLP